MGGAQALNLGLRSLDPVSLLEDIFSKFDEEALGSKTAPIKDKQRETWEKKTQETLGREGGRGEQDYGIQARLSLPVAN